jgi:hypothetical protein
MRTLLKRAPLELRPGDKAGLAVAAVLLVAFVAVLASTIIDRGDLKPEYTADLRDALASEGVQMGAQPACRPRQTYQYLCDVELAGDVTGTVTYDMRWKDSGCWRARVVYDVPAGADVPDAVDGCVGS